MKYELSDLHVKNIKLVIEETTCKVKDIHVLTDIIKALNTPIVEKDTGVGDNN